MKKSPVQLDIVERLENSASVVHGTAYSVMMDARKLLLTSRRGPVDESFKRCAREVANMLQTKSGTVHDGASKVMLEAKELLLALAEPTAQ